VLRAAIAVVLVLATPAAADDLAVDVPRTAAVTGAAIGVWGGSELLKDDLVAGSCRWCEPGALDRHVRAKLLWGDPQAASFASSVGFAALPAGLALADLAARRDLRLAAEDALVALEALALAEVVTQGAKFVVARRRPAAWAAGSRHEADDDLSFFSGHASGAFAVAGAFGTIARLRGDGGAAAVYAAGFAGATAVAYLRVAADKHWLTDAAAGAAVGALVGIGAPLLLHRKTSGGPTVGVAPGSVSLTFVF
jgi:membrane-associated phospholipid phosphatase